MIKKRKPKPQPAFVTVMPEPKLTFWQKVQKHFRDMGDALRSH